MELILTERLDFTMGHSHVDQLTPAEALDVALGVGNVFANHLELLLVS